MPPRAKPASRTVNKTELIRNVAMLLDKSPAAVSEVVEAFLYAVKTELVELNEVYIHGFGIFKTTVRTGKRAATAELTAASGKKITVLVRRKYYVSFRRARALRDQFKERHGKEKVI